LAEIDDDAEKMFDRLYLELQVLLLQMAGAGTHGFTEWQCANLTDWTNKLITDIFVTVLSYQCSLPQGNGFSVEIANLYALFLLTWWNMDPIQPSGSITSFDEPRHGFPLVANDITKYVSSLAYVDVGTRLVVVRRDEHSVEEFFIIVQGYCDLLAEFSLVIKMVRNVKKCTLYLYNVPEGTEIPEFHSIAWSYDSQGPAKGTIATTVVKRDSENNLLCYQVDKTLLSQMPQPIRSVLATRKYLGVSFDAQLNNIDGKERMIKKINQPIGLVSATMNSIREARIAHNMLVCQVATFSPICIAMSLKDCANIDKAIIKSYHYRLKLMTHDAKHSIFISEASGGIGVKSFTMQYVGALLCDLEVYLLNDGSMPTHALIASVEAARKNALWKLWQDGKIPSPVSIYETVQKLNIAEKKTLIFQDTADCRSSEVIAYDHPHCMEKAIRTTSAFGFMLRDMNQEFSSRFADNLLLADKKANTLGGPRMTNRAHLGGNYWGRK